MNPPPSPGSPGGEPADDPRVAAIGTAARELVEQRDRWLNRPADDRPPTTDDRSANRVKPLSSVVGGRPIAC